MLAAVRGRTANEQRHSRLLRSPTLLRSNACCRRCCRSIDLPRALLRGRYMAAAATMEFNGIPIDVPTLSLLRKHWTEIKDQLIAAIDADYGVFDGQTFKADRFEAFLARHGHPVAAVDRAAHSISTTTPSAKWRKPIRSSRRCTSCGTPCPRCGSTISRRRGRPQSHDAVGLPLAHRPQSAEQHQVHFRPERLAARPDQAAPGTRVAYIDWSNQEFGIAAKLSGDRT